MLPSTLASGNQQQHLGEVGDGGRGSAGQWEGGASPGPEHSDSPFPEPSRQ